MFIETEAVPLRNAVVIPFVRDAFGPDGQPVNPETDIRLQVMLDDLAWWSSALEQARAAGELTPGVQRVRAALAAGPDSLSTAGGGPVTDKYHGGHMSFDTAAGTRGARQPNGWAFRQVNKLMASRVRRGGTVRGFNALVLITVGRKTGAERRAPVGWFPGPDGSWLIVASAAGAAGNPAWYYNIAAHPDRVQIEINGRTDARWPPSSCTGAQRAEAWQQIIAAAPRFAGYQDKTDRELPVIRLVPEFGQAAG